MINYSNKKKDIMKNTLLFSLVLLNMLVVAIYPKDNNKFNKYTAEATEQERLIYNMEFELERSADPATGEVPTNIRQEEINFVRNIPYYRVNNSMRKLSGDDFAQSTGIEFNWQQRGPWNTGGRFLCIALDLDNENIINAGAASGGMWRSIDKGKSWVKTSDLLAVQSIYCLTQDKRKGKHNIWYYGTGEMLSTTDRSVSIRVRTMDAGGGIWKSTDNGGTWSPLESTLGGDPAYPDNPFQGVWNIVVDEKNQFGDVLFASCYGGIYRSENGGKTWNMALGDKTNMPFSSYIIQNKMGVFYAAVANMTLSGKKSSVTGVFRSTDGIHWDDITPEDFPETIRTIKLAASPDNPNIVYVLAEKPPRGDDPYYFGSNAKDHFFWKYTDKLGGTGKWENRSEFLPNGTNKIARINTLGSYAMTLTVKPDDPNTVILGATNVYVSTDGFTSHDNTTHIGGYFPKGGYDLDNEYCHPDIHCFFIPQSNSKALYVANDGGIHYTKNYTVEEPDWKSLNNGLFATQFYTVAIDQGIKNDPFVFGGLQDNSSQYTYSDSKNNPWQAVIGGDGMASVVGANKTFVLGSWYNGGMVSFRFDEDTIPEHFLYQRPSFLESGNFTFYTLFELDKNDNNTLYLPAKRELWRKLHFEAATLDKKLIDSNWTKIATVPSGHYITALAVSVEPANIVLIGTNKGKVYRIDDAKSDNPQITEITDNVFPANAYCSGLDIDPKNADDIIVVFSNYHVKSIFRSTDGGGSFAEVGGNLEDNPDGTGAGPGVRRVKKVYTEDGHAFYLAATTSGLFVNTGLADDIGNTEWERAGADKFGNVIIDWIDASLKGDRVAIATQGAGVWTATFTVTGVNEQDKDYDFYLDNCYPNPASTRTIISFTIDKSAYISLKLFDVAGRQIDLITEKDYAKGVTRINYDVSGLKDGVYFLHLQANGKSMTKRIIVLK
jgi:hypothetical protein